MNRPVDVWVVAQRTNPLKLWGVYFTQKEAEVRAETLTQVNIDVEVRNGALAWDADIKDVRILNTQKD